MISVGIMMTKLNAGGMNIKNCLEKLGWDVTILGLGQKWGGWTMRMTLYADFAASKPTNSIIVFIDAFDALVTRSPEGFQELFESFGTDIVIGAENYCGNNCSPITQWWSEHSNTIQNYGNLYVQGGCVVGKAHALEQMYKWCLTENITDDQIGIAAFINQKKSNNIFLDFENKICYHDNFGSTGNFSIHDGLVTAYRGDLVTNPFFVHFPGFLVWRSTPLIHTTNIPELKNYNFVAQHVLQEEFVEIGQMDTLTVTSCNITILILISLLLLFFVIFFGLFCLYYYRNRKNEQKLKANFSQIKK